MPDGFQHIGRFFIIFGLVIIVVGFLLMILGKISWLGRLPGDILIQEKNFILYFPVATSILISICLTLLFWIFGRK